MIDEIYQEALAYLRDELSTRGIPFVDDEGELVFAGHRLGLAVQFDGYLPQGRRVLAPLEIQICLNQGEPGRFAVGTIGEGGDQREARRAALDEWFALAALPVLEALAESAGKTSRLDWGAWQAFPGQASFRGRVPAGMKLTAPLYRELLTRLAGEVADWTRPPHDDLKSVGVMVAWAEGEWQIQTTVDGQLDGSLAAEFGQVDWPRSIDPWLYKQLFVLRPVPEIG